MLHERELPPQVLNCHICKTDPGSIWENMEKALDQVAMRKSLVEFPIQPLDQFRTFGNQFAVIEVENRDHLDCFRRTVSKNLAIGRKFETLLAGALG